MLVRVLLIAAVVAASATAASAQTIGPGGGPIAPGPSQPRDFTPGGTGPTLDSPTVAPSSGGVRTTIRTKRQKYRGKSRRRMGPES